MARTTPVARARTALTGLLILLFGMGGLLTYGVQQGEAQWSPLLALDLEGGTQMVLSPQLDETEGEVDDEQLEQAVEIIRQRVDGTGVSEAEIATQGAENIVVGMPGVPDEETRELIQASADMEFRPVLQISQDTDYMEDLAAQDEELEGTADQDEQAAPEDEETAQEDGDGSAEDDEEAAQPEDFPEPEAEPQDNSDPNWITQELAADFENYTCSRDVSLEERAAADPEEPLIACDPESGMKYLLGPVDVPGTHIDDADFGMEQTGQGISTGGWAVNLSFDSEGREEFADSSTRLNALEGQRNQFAIMLDGQVISAPSMNAPITDGNAQITGNFTEEEARNLSEQLRYGSLPISFDIESEEQISATLGEDQLRMGLLAGVIGLALTAAYALFQYRALGLVTITSLVVAGLLTWWAIALLGWSEGYRLSLAGIAGLIVSIGLTADSFIVYFERVKDELREGRSLAGAVETGWSRARRTILASKAVNIIAAVVLYLVAVGNVRGFAFTLGLTAVIDVILVFLFTHPLMQILARRKFFAAGRRFSGLSEKELGVDVLYRGQGRFARRQVVYSDPAAVGAATPEESEAEAADAEETVPSPAASSQPGAAGSERAQERRRRGEHATADRIEAVPDISDAEWATMTIAERRKAREEAARKQAEAASGDDEAHEEEEAR
ncbi:protein translocase subunit SecD [Nesterenkonia lacusekhoensis]|uniref:Protein translocase subunit SecD n=1 Tax=Nesterenkonia lacusekhoensis TaxID=150832 RepID=A0ABS4T0R6_9MICC|nr:protein translocase subunit SecD [Nesterenkonia lacusekhoensis]MBP2318048.1 preprotein translocase subunit SecD [Nesterenkonia lacusekhoensis]